MADSTTSTPSDTGGTKSKGKGGIKAFIRKNKTLSAVAGVGGLYFLWKMRQEPPGEPTVPLNEEATEGAASSLEGTASLAAYEVGRSERATERAEEDSAEMEAERIKEREKNKEEKEEREENSPPLVTGPDTISEPPLPDPGPTSESPSPSAGTNGISLHGKSFPGATGSHIAKTGQTVGGKKYVEYAVQFPGRVEHWQYFTETGNWRQVNNTASGAGGGGQGTPTAGESGKNSHGGGVGAAKPQPVAVGPAKALPAPKKDKGGGGKTTGGNPQPAPAQNTQGGVPQQNAQHPAAVNTGNRCINGGVGGHTAPPGWHLFCQGGYIWRAPN